ncbi:uncharacterized protein J8A68_000209 [[Candida] subhashii]|uniref:Uncharacterized protein n=1 Tax=[Candida] subhashii TaxID=561895 RepID=A0A8J5USB7_9ASCO|nr:uncharacterized protein J8A68_000209 [[Candida] subhashii]KAG7666256.1 hypothetical protein J8A68_000209 [[Candida] subhashii]
MTGIEVGEREEERNILESKINSEQPSAAFQQQHKNGTFLNENRESKTIDERLAELAVESKDGTRRRPLEGMVRRHLPGIILKPVDNPTTEVKKPVPVTIFEPSQEETINGRNDPLIGLKLENLQNKLQNLQIDRFQWGRIASFYISGDLIGPYRDRVENPEDKEKGIQWRDVALLIAEYSPLAFIGLENSRAFFGAMPEPNQNVSDFIRDLKFKSRLIPKYQNKFVMVKYVVLSKLIGNFRDIIDLYDFVNAREDDFFPLIETAFSSKTFPEDIKC